MFNLQITLILLNNVARIILLLMFVYIEALFVYREALFVYIEALFVYIEALNHLHTDECCDNDHSFICLVTNILTYLNYLFGMLK